MITAFLFPGQGSQTVGMLSQLAEKEPLITEFFEQASAIFGEDLWKVVQENPADSLNQTLYTQPILLTASVALYQLVLKKNSLPVPHFMAGHSLGEYSALVCADAIQFEDALKLVILRARLMQDACQSAVGMLAVLGLGDNVVLDLCKQVTDAVLEPANYNAPGQVVVAGEIAALEKFEILARAAGAKLLKRLPMSVVSHCQLLKTAAADLATALTEIELRMPTIPVVHNVNMTVAQTPTEIKQNLAAQLYSSVHWWESIEFMGQQGVTGYYEIGPGKVLSGLNKRIPMAATCLPIESIL